MSLTCAAGDLKQHDTSLAKSRDVASTRTPLSGAGKPKPLVPCMWPWAEPNLVACRMRPGCGPLKRLEDRKAKAAVPQGRDLIPARSTTSPSRVRSLSLDLLHMSFLNSYRCTSSLHSYTKARAF